MEALFWILFAILLYIYAGYPLLVWLVGSVRARAVHKRWEVPTVSILIAAHNEEASLALTLHNKLDLDYPKEKVEIIVVSDGSTDRTDRIATSFDTQSVTLLRQEPRNGKTSALNLAAGKATGDILVFADANSLYERTALRHLVANFADPTVGYVTGTLAYHNPDGSMTASGCGLYMRYENFIRRWETRVGSLVGVNGGIDAVRRSLYQVMKAEDLSDLVLPLRVIQRGYRVVYEPLAMLAETALTTPRDEYRMRVRVAARALWALADLPGLLNLFRHGFYSIQIVSHKVLRYLAPFLMVGLYLAALMLWQDGLLYRAAFLVQTLCVVLALGGYYVASRGAASRILGVFYYFTLVNCAALHACCRFLMGRRSHVWTPRLG